MAGRNGSVEACPGFHVQIGEESVPAGSEEQADGDLHR